MTPQADFAVKTHFRANGHQACSIATDRSSVYDILYSPDKPSSFYSSDEQLQNSKIASAGCIHLIDIKHHQAIPNHSDARAIFRQNLSIAVDYGIAWKIATSDVKTSVKSDEKKKSSKRRKLHQEVNSVNERECNHCQKGNDRSSTNTAWIGKDSCTTLHVLSTDIEPPAHMLTLQVPGLRHSRPYSTASEERESYFW